MNERTFEAAEPAQIGTGRERQEAQEADVIDLGRASERTRGSFTGFIVEPSAFPLRDL